MEALRNALAILAALEARYHDLVDPQAQTADAVKALTKEIAAAVESLHERLAALETAVEAISHAPAIESDVQAASAKTEPQPEPEPAEASAETPPVEP